MENGVAYKNNLSGVLILEITSACRDKNKKNLALDFLFRREMKAGLTSLLGYIFLNEMSSKNGRRYVLSTGFPACANWLHHSIIKPDGGAASTTLDACRGFPSLHTHWHDEQA
jgi:hypothetical protein